MKYTYLLISFLIHTFSIGQTIQGMVVDEKNQPLIGATVLELGTSNGVIVNPEGRFTLNLTTTSKSVIVSFTGFATDTLEIGTGHIHIVMKENSSELEEVVVTASSSFLDDLESRHTEIITEAELTKAACCNLSESFETNASVDVSFTDAVTGAKTIQMLGLSGRYVQINRENIPNVRGLLGRNGLSFIPGTWVQTINVGKGAGTVVNGYESMTGQINVELKKPENSETLYLNTYANSFGRLELNANHARNLNENWSTGLLLHMDYLGSEVDQNEDGFMDIPKSKQLNIMNRYQYRGEKFVTQLGFNVTSDVKAGGQLGFDFDDDSRSSTQYGFSSSTNRFELFGKTGLLFQHKPYKGWGFIYAASINDINSGFGREEYKGREKTFYGNLIFQNIIGTTSHQYKSGASILLDDFDESYADSLFSRKEIVPGVFFEYNYLPNDNFSLVAGARADFHNLYGTFLTPRLHSKWQVNEQTTLRASLGSGFRTANPLIENSTILVSSRRLIVEEGLNPEKSWNLGGSLSTGIPLASKELALTIDYFYTNFRNQLIYDLDQSSEQISIYNLRGKSYAHSLQVEGSYSFSDKLSAKAAYKLYDVKSTINERLREVPFISRNRFFLNTSYATKYDRWKADLTLQWFGPKRLPNTNDKPLEFQRLERSPDFFLLNVQVSRGYRWGSVYLGSENLLGFTQENPIIDPQDPFGANFDASLVWAPIAGRLIYAGFRYKIKRQ